LRRFPIGKAGLAVVLGLFVQAGAVAGDGLHGPKADAPERSEIQYWDSVINRLKQPSADGPLTEAQRKSYLTIETDRLDPTTTRIRPPLLPKARLSTERSGLGLVLP